MKQKSPGLVGSFTVNGVKRFRTETSSICIDSQKVYPQLGASTQPQPNSQWQTLPFTSERSSDGSYTVGTMMVCAPGRIVAMPNPFAIKGPRFWDTNPAPTKNVIVFIPWWLESTKKQAHQWSGAVPRLPPGPSLVGWCCLSRLGEPTNPGDFVIHAAAIKSKEKRRHVYQFV